MHNEVIAGVDIGLSGGISTQQSTISIPIYNVLTKKALYVQALVGGKKVYYKTGDKKGQVKMKLKQAAKFKRELDLFAIRDIFKDVDIVVFEQPGISIGNSARSSSTTNRNFGKLLAVAELCLCEIITVAPHKWKKDLGLSKEKIDSIIMAEKLLNKSFRTTNGALLDGPAEALLIAHWYKKTKEKE